MRRRQRKQQHPVPLTRQEQYMMWKLEQYEQYNKPRFTWFKTFLFAAGLLVVLILLWCILQAVHSVLQFFGALIAPYVPYIGPILFLVVMLALVAGIIAISLKLYGYSQEQFKKRDDRDIVRAAKDEQVIVRETRGALTTRPIRSLAAEEERRTLSHRARVTRDFREQYQEEPRQRRQLLAPPSGLQPFNAAYPGYPDSPGVQRAAQVPGVDPSTPAKPRMVYFSSVRASIQPGLVLLGIRPDGALRLEQWGEALKTFIVLGAMASGKTTTLAEKAAEAAQGRADLVLCDPHMTKPDSLYHRIAPLARFQFPGTTFAMSHDDILENVRVVHDELERRIQGGHYTKPLVLIIDEVNRLLDDEEIAQDLLSIVKKLGREGRDFQVYGGFGMHEVSGYAAFVKKVTAYIVHRCDKREAEKVLPDRFVKLVPELPNGLTFVKDAFGQTEQFQQCYFTYRDAEMIASEIPGSYSSHTVPHAPQRPSSVTRDIRPRTTINGQAFLSSAPNVPNVSKRNEASSKQRLARLAAPGETSFETFSGHVANVPPKQSGIPDELRQKIIALRKQGLPRRKIMMQLNLHGAKYELIRQVLDEAGL